VTRDGHLATIVTSNDYKSRIELTMPTTRNRIDTRNRIFPAYALIISDCLKSFMKLTLYRLAILNDI
jgi:hypothetical protein